MITETLVELIYMPIGLLVVALPDMVTGFGDSIGGFIELLEAAAIFVPMNVFVPSILSILSLYTLKFGIATMNWLIRKVPTIS